MWRHQIGVLQDHGWHTLAIDPPGHGQSTGPGRRFTMDECAQAALEILDAVGINNPVAYLGTSWGGFVAPRIALRAPRRLRGMVLFNTSAERGTQFERMKSTVLTKLMAIGRLDDVTAHLIVSGLLTPETQRGQPEIGADLSTHMLAWERRNFINSVRSVLIDRDPVLDALVDVHVPTLVVSGAQDHTLPSIHGRRIADHLPGARHVEVAGAAHLVPLENPHEANSLILDFLQQLPRT